QQTATDLADRVTREALDEKVAALVDKTTFEQFRADTNDALKQRATTTEFSTFQQQVEAWRGGIETRVKQFEDQNPHLVTNDALNERLAPLVDRDALAAGLRDKADRSEMNGLLATKVDTTKFATELVLKADATSFESVRKTLLANNLRLVDR